VLRLTQRFCRNDVNIQSRRQRMTVDILCGAAKFQMNSLRRGACATVEGI
jgi:hypothetical protein